MRRVLASSELIDVQEHLTQPVPGMLQLSINSMHLLILVAVLSKCKSTHQLDRTSSSL